MMVDCVLLIVVVVGLVAGSVAAALVLVFVVVVVLINVQEARWTLIMRSDLVMVVHQRQYPLRTVLRRS